MFAIRFEIYITYGPGTQIENGFTHLLRNTSKDLLVPANLAVCGLQGAPGPILYISLLFGEDDHDITKQKLDDNNISIDVSAPGTYAETIQLRNLGQGELRRRF